MDSTIPKGLPDNAAPAIGMVLVSHSRRLAAAAADLVSRLTQETVRIAYAGGAAGDDHELGTDATDIMDAIQRVDAGHGVIVLTDLGSAILSAAMAKGLLEGQVDNIVLAPAPLIEGGLAAAVQLSAGADIAVAVQEARDAIMAKAAYIDSGDENARAREAGDALPPVPKDAERVRFVVTDPNGLHVRPAVALIKALEPFDVEARLRNASAKSPFVPAGSLNQIALSAVASGETVELAFWGADAAAAASAVAAVAENELLADAVEIRGHHAAAGAATRVVSYRADEPGRICLAPGFADGILSISLPVEPDLPARPVADPAVEEQRFRDVVAAVGRDLRRFAEIEADKDDLVPLHDAQILILEDPEIVESVCRDIRKSACDAASRYQTAMTHLADQYRSLATPYLRVRAADVQAVADRVLRKLLGRTEPVHGGDDASVVVFAPEIGVGHVLRSEGHIAGALTTVGGTTSHATLAMRANQVPFIGGVVLPPGAKNGDRVLVDAERTEVIVNPSPEDVAAFDRRRRCYDEARERNRADSLGSAVTADGLRIHVLANVGDTARDLVAGGSEVDGIGLVRTEFAFLGNLRAPDTKDQVRRLRAVFAAAPGKTVIVRTLDAGGDKNLPWIGLPTEANPFLGIRGIRLARRRPALLRPQMEAILLARADPGPAARGARIGQLVPLVSVLEEIDEFFALLEESHNALAAAGRDHAWPVARGVMMETPAAVAQADAIAGRVDFMSIGSNDLTQYLMCVERGSTELAYLTDSMHPVVLVAIERIIRAGKAADIPVSVCGELAADPEGAQALIGLGLTRLSVDVHAVGPIKRLIRNTDAARLRALAREALAAPDAATARRLFTENAAPKRNETE